VVSSWGCLSMCFSRVVVVRTWRRLSKYYSCVVVIRTSGRLSVYIDVVFVVLRYVALVSVKLCKVGLDSLMFGGVGLF